MGDKAMSLPDKSELAIIQKARKDAGADPSAEANAIEAFAAGDYTTDQVDSWFAVQRVKQPELWSPAAGTLGEHGELIEKAFTGKGSLKARTELIKQIGEEAAHPRDPNTPAGMFISQ